MDLAAVITGSIAILSLFVGLPAIVLPFIYKNTKHKRETELEKIRLEIERDSTRLKLLDAEDRKLDRIIDGRSGA